MTKVRHYISSITQEGMMVNVVFKQKIDNAIILKYIADARKAWSGDGMPGELPKNVVDFLKEQRFNNEFDWSFPLNQWNKANMKIFDAVDIDMPLTIDDFVKVEENLT